MGEISAELKKFKSSVEPNLSSMSSTCTSLESKIQDASTASQTAKSSFDSSYNSQNKTTIMSRFDKLSDIYTKISNSLGSDFKGIISEAEAIVNAVTELENINKEIETQQGIVNSNSGTEEAAVSKKTAAQNIINEKNTEFNKKHEEAKKKLEALKTKDADISFVTEFSPSNTEADPADLQYGSFEKREFTASNGLKIQYWLYVPDYGKDVEGLPAMLYMHGGSTHQSIGYNDAIRYGLSSKIANRELTPSGVVIIPCVCDFTDRGVQALKELTDSVVTEQKCDTNRVSVSGHSYGGITAYKLVNNYPGYWSACVPISGSANVTQSFGDVPVWSFNGTYENGEGNTGYRKCASAVDQINKIGGKAFLTPIKTGHAGTNKDTYGREWQSPDGDMINPLEWAFRQERA